MTQPATAILRREPGAELTVDGSAIAFCDSVGISALVGLRQLCDQPGWLLRIVHTRPLVRRLLVDSTGLGEYLNVL